EKFSAGKKTGINEASVKEALSQVIDPDLHKDIVSLGFVQRLDIKGDHVAVVINLTTPACPVKEKLKAECEAALKQIPGVQSVDVTMTATTRAAANAQALSGTLAQVKNIIAVAAGKGGVG